MNENPDAFISDGQNFTDIRKGHLLDIENLTAYLNKELPGFKGPVEVKQFGFGQSNPTYLLEDQGTRKQYVLRKKPEGKLIKGAHAVEREYRVIKALNSTIVPTPKVYVLCEDSSVVGTPFYVMEFCKGRIYTDGTLKDVNKSDRKLYYQAAAETLCRLHKVDFRAVGLEGFGKAGGYYSRQLQTLQKVSKLQAEKAPPIPNLESMVQFLNANQPVDLITIVHGDYKLDNLVFHPTEPRVIAILDWEMSTIGNPLADLGNFTGQMYGSIGEASPLKGASKAKLAELGIPNEDQFVEMYYNLMGEDRLKARFPDPWYTYHKTFYFFKVTVILQGIAMRVAKGVASSGSAAAFSKMLPMLAAYSWSWCKQLQKTLAENNLLKKSLGDSKL